MTYKTEELRRLITTKLDTLDGRTYYRRAAEDASHPYKVFTLSRVNLGDLSRDDVELTVDIWDHARDPKVIDRIADEMEALLNDENDPQDAILPTFFRESRYPVEESDKDIQHLQLTFICELYENQ